MKLFAITTVLLSLLPLTANAFLTYEEMQNKMLGLANKYSERVTFFELTKSEDGTAVNGLYIKGENQKESIKQVVVGTHHGDEWGAAAVVLSFAEDIAQTPLIDRDVYVIPVLIPDAYRADSRYYRGVNPNRDYPGPCGSHDGNDKLKPFSLKATYALSELIRINNVVAAITVHNPWGTVHYPWNDQRNTYTNDHVSFVKTYEDAYSGTDYKHGTVADLFYTMKGGFEDFVYWEYGVWGYLVEVGGGKKPSESILMKETSIQLRAFRKILLNGPTIRSDQHSHPGCEQNNPLAALLYPYFEAQE